MKYSMRPNVQEGADTLDGSPHRHLIRNKEF